MHQKSPGIRNVFIPARMVNFSGCCLSTCCPLVDFAEACVWPSLWAHQHTPTPTFIWCSCGLLRLPLQLLGLHHTTRRVLSGMGGGAAQNLGPQTTRNELKYDAEPDFRRHGDGSKRYRTPGSPESWPSRA